MGCLCLGHHQERCLHGPQRGWQHTSKSILVPASHTSSCSASPSLDFSWSSLQEDYRMPRSPWLGLKTWDVSKDSVCCYEVFICNISNQHQCVSLCLKRCFHSQMTLLHAWLRDLGSFSMGTEAISTINPKVSTILSLALVEWVQGMVTENVVGLMWKWQPSLSWYCIG